MSSSQKKNSDKGKQVVQEAPEYADGYYDVAVHSDGWRRLRQRFDGKWHRNNFPLPNAFVQPLEKFLGEEIPFHDSNEQAWVATKTKLRRQVAFGGPGWVDFVQHAGIQAGWEVWLIWKPGFGFRVSLFDLERHNVSFPPQARARGLADSLGLPYLD